MGMSRSLVAYADCQTVLDRALESNHGVALTFDAPGKAVHFRQRCYAFRKLLNEQLEGKKDIFSGNTYDTVNISREGRVLTFKVVEEVGTKIVELRK